MTQGGYQRGQGLRAPAAGATLRYRLTLLQSGRDAEASRPPSLCGSRHSLSQLLRNLTHYGTGGARVKSQQTVHAVAQSPAWEPGPRSKPPVPGQRQETVPSPRGAAGRPSDGSAAPERSSGLPAVALLENVHRPARPSPRATAQKTAPRRLQFLHQSLATCN